MNNVKLKASASPSTEYANLLQQENPLLVDPRQQSQFSLLYYTTQITLLFLSILVLNLKTIHIHSKT